MGQFVSPGAPTIRLNTDLAGNRRNASNTSSSMKMAHMLESTHNRRFVALMDLLIPNWQIGKC
jgi:hypothetical protein